MSPVRAVNSLRDGLSVDGTRCEPDDRELLRRIGTEDLAAFELFYRRHYLRLRRFVGRIGERAEIVEEVINDTMLVVWQRADTFRGDALPTTWLMGIAWRKTKDRLRGRASEPGTVELDEVVLEDPLKLEEWVEDRQFGRIVRDCLQDLSPAHRAVVELTYFDGYSSREIAQILDCPEGTVRTRMLHARRKLKSLLTERLTPVAGEET